MRHCPFCSTSAVPQRLGSARLKPRVKTISGLAAQVDEAQLDRLFAALAHGGRRAVLAAICRGVVTGAALVDKLKRREHDVAKQLGVLSRAGLVVGRRERRWVRLLPEADVVRAATAWVATLRASEPPPVRRYGDTDERNQLARALRNSGRRRMLTHLCGPGIHTQAAVGKACGLPQALASRGLMKLSAVGLASSERAGRAKRYAAGFEAVEGLWEWLNKIETALIEGRPIAQSVELAEPVSTTRVAATSSPDAGAHADGEPEPDDAADEAQSEAPSPRPVEADVPEIGDAPGREDASASSPDPSEDSGS